MEKIKFKIPYSERGVIRSCLFKIKFNKDEKVWEANDTPGTRYHANNGLKKYCISDTTLPEKDYPHDINYIHNPWEHQRKAFNVVSNFQNSYIYMIPGVGKSKVIVDYYNSNDVKRILIVCPKKVISTWHKQFKEHCNKKYLMIPLDKGTSENKSDFIKKAITQKRFIIVVNYETIWRLEIISKINWDMVIFDEIHRLQSSSTNVSKFCKKLKSEKKVGLTGTPGEPKKWHGQFLSIDPNIFGTNRARFIDKYFNVDYFGNPKSIKNNEISKIFGFFSYVNIKELDIPEPQHMVVDITNSSKKQYKQIEDEFYLEVENGVITVANAMVKSIKLRQICSGFIMDESRSSVTLNTAKMDTLHEMLSDMEGINIVVFYNFKHEETQIREVAKKLKRTYGNISGSNADMHCVDNPEPGTLLSVQIRAGGTGIDGIQNNYDYCFFYSLTWSEIDNEQAMRRVHRGGRKKQAFFYHFITKGTVEEKVYKSIKNKEKVLKEVLNV